jgi:hypothetical protein
VYSEIRSSQQRIFPIETNVEKVEEPKKKERQTEKRCEVMDYINFSAIMRAIKE